LILYIILYIKNQVKDCKIIILSSCKETKETKKERRKRKGKKKRKRKRRRRRRMEYVFCF